MKIAVNIARVIVGVLFIFSGLVKANDPLGLSYKMQEFFEIWGMTRFYGFTLWLAVFMNAFEIIAGVALLVGWRIRIFSWLLLLLIIFFTFLTGYTFYTGKPLNCGCFGDCLPITSGTSFAKDVVLTILIAFIFIKQSLIRPLTGKRSSFIILLLTVIFSFGLQWYTLKFLPVVDCLPFKKGNNITEKMQIPAGALPDSFAIRFVYSKGGKNFEFSPSELPADLATYTYVDRVDKLVRLGTAVPPIKGFALSGLSGEDSTAVILAQPTALLLFNEDFNIPVSSWSDAFTPVYKRALELHIPVYAIVNSKEQAIQRYAAFPFAGIQVLSCDNTTIRTAARSNPCLFLLRSGTVIAKEAAPRMDRINKLLTP